MSKKALLLLLVLAALAGGFAGTLAEAGGTDGGGSSCPICTTYADGSQCCVSCWCDETGFPVACTNHYCPPAGSGGVRD